ncbi:quinone-dependent dihydroorotate dehydrogenase [Prochlorococcus sp. MIT 1223]|uniref:quinone-dependent dihydroorotate dehydrogenase n=1 Tax=Prochlorococcus sp. MIT 1223 TaxID=3096217 RepID=UPI002A74DE53|nr:quinone-dependent dihydroorotate dehydrogenase [Prochlorococcus sp. MIT 1223]
MNQSFTKNVIYTQELYKKFIGPILAKDEGFDAEQLSDIALMALSKASMYRQWPGISLVISQLKRDLQIHNVKLEQQLFGCHFNNPVGLAAGFDKNGIAAGIWDSFGFGFAEIGTVTWHPQPGNQKPRLFRLAQEKGALNRMGFNNKGAKKMGLTIEKQGLKKSNLRPTVLGINLGKSKVTSLEKAPEDYAASLEVLASLADYVVINISSPNTPGLRKLQDSNKLIRLIKKLKTIPLCPPLLVKIAPDLNNSEIDCLAKLASEEGLAGIVAVNTSLNRLGLEKRLISQTGIELGKESGGLSGDPLQGRAIEVLRRLRYNSVDLKLIGVGGISTPKSAWERIAAGASLIQLYTGWIFEGPILVPMILEGLLTQIDRHGFKNISDAIGTEAPWI